MPLLRDPLLWLLVLFAALLIGLPHSEPLFHALFPEQPRPLYQQAGFFSSPWRMPGWWGSPACWQL